MRLAIDVTLDYALPRPADVMLLIEAAALPDQHLEEQDLRVTSALPLVAQPGLEGVGQRTWAHGIERFVATYRAVVRIDRPAIDLAALPATPLPALPGAVVPYLLPSRYCEVERFERFVQTDFAGLAGGALAAALAAWVRDHVAYQVGSTHRDTSATTTFAERRGVCRDFAHLLVTLARAGGIPARCVSAYAPGVDPPDFHAVAELWLDGAWHLVDATGMAAPDELARVAVGRDATEIAFMTVFGAAQFVTQSVSVVRLGS